MAKRTNKSGATHSRKAAKITTVSKSNDVKGNMKMTMYTAPTMVPRSQIKERRAGRQNGGKRLALPRSYSGKARSMAQRSLDPCENSNDSGLGFENHLDHHSTAIPERLNWNDERSNPKRAKLDIKLENDEVNENYTFPEHRNSKHNYRDNAPILRSPSASLLPLNVCEAEKTVPLKSAAICPSFLNRNPVNAPLTLTSQLQASSKYRNISLSIVCQPEQQHRARYQTEGSRGAVKDRSGNGFPMVQLKGYNKPASLQVFIGTDFGKVGPHMFYQACRVSGKNSTPCNEAKIDGTIVIELQIDPSKDMIATCDCVGILKERNVDVEHRFPDQLASRSKKKSTRCRMVFRTTIVHDDGTPETLQICSQPIVCTQPPGIPEISKKSLTSCPASGGLELFIIGKNFLKDTLVYFQTEEDIRVCWKQSVVPDKEYLQQTHLVCVVPPYLHPDITEPVTVRLFVMSSGKMSEAHQFVYTPVNGALPSVHVERQPQTTPFPTKMLWSSMTKQEQDVGMMPPPGTNLVPLSQRRSSLISSDSNSPPLRTLKQEMMDENSQNSVLDPSEMRQGRFRHISESSLDVHPGDSNISILNENSIDVLKHSSVISESVNSELLCENSVSNDGSFVLLPPNVNDVMDLRMKMGTVADLVDTKAPSLATLQSFGVTESTLLPLPAQSAQSVENYLTDIENKGETTREFLSPILKNNSPSNVITTILPPPITTGRLDVFVNCSVNTHMAQQKQNDVLLTTQGLINTLSPIMSTNVLSSPSPGMLNNNLISSAAPSDVTQNLTTQLLAVPENAILLTAAADLLETQKKISDLNSIPDANTNIINNILTSTQADVLPNLATENNFFTSSAPIITNDDKKFNHKNSNEKKPDDTMIPTSFTTMSENDLINIINPSCFDQGNSNNSNFH